MKYCITRSFYSLALPAIACTLSLLWSAPTHSQTTSLWLFDEQQGLYPSSVIENSSDNDYPMVLGLRGKIVKGKYGNALEIGDILKVDIPEGDTLFGLKKLSAKKLTWYNADYGALMTTGQKHLRNQVGFANSTDAKLNLGNSAWTAEFWIKLKRETNGERCIFEIGQGPILENSAVTGLYVTASGDLQFRNDPSTTKILLSSGKNILDDNWHHIALVHDPSAKNVSYYIDGKLSVKKNGIVLKGLPHGEESYMSLGTTGKLEDPLYGCIDELKFSSSKLYAANFKLPVSSSPVYLNDYHSVALKKGPGLLFDHPAHEVIQLGDRKHVFIDSAFVSAMKDLEFTVNPPVQMERVIDNISGQFRKHLTVVEDEKGLIRIYNGSVDDYLAVFTSKDGIHFEAPDLGHGAIKGKNNIVIAVPNGGLGNPFIDPNGPPQERWKFISDYHRRGVYLYTSSDGYAWTRKKTALLPFRSGSQACTFYDDQRQRYVTYHRSDAFALPNDQTKRSSAITESTDLNKPMHFDPKTAGDYRKFSDSIPLRDPKPWFLDNGPLTPGGFGIEFPHAFDPIPEDPAETDIYVTKAQKYAWAPDTYVAFPIVYFHYEGAGIEARRTLEDQKYQRGSGPIETQLSVSRDGLHWERYPRPAYVGIGQHLGRDIKTAYIAQGMVKRGNEIWQYYFGETQYHSAIKKDEAGRGVYRLVQRLDGFVSVDSRYDKAGELVTKPFTFTGNTLELNIDTDAAGYAQVGFLDEHGNAIKGFSVDDCVYINGDFIDAKAEWLNKGSDLSALQGKTVQLVFRMRGSKLYAMQFVNNNSTPIKTRK